MARVLVVDDDDDLREVVMLKLRRSGHDVRGLGDPREALVAVAVEHVDLVVLDWCMPYLVGSEVCAHIRMLPHAAGVPVIITTAFDEPDVRRQAMAAGATAFLPKPFALRDLGALVAASLDASAAAADVLDLPQLRRLLPVVPLRPHPSCPAAACVERACPDRLPACAHALPSASGW